nr:amidohydrolase family protein [Ktedonobacterales bacterium]
VRGNLGVAIHAIGDRAVRVALDAIAATKARTNTSRRFRLEHVQLIDSADVERMATLGVVASVQPFHAVSDRDVAERLWGDRIARAYAYATLADAGVPVVLGSDVPIETADPWRIIHAAVARTDDAPPHRPAWHPEQALSLARALWGYTAGPAWAAGEEAHAGRLVPGALADCLILPEEPTRLALSELARFMPEMVFVGGRLVNGEHA